MLLGTVTIKHYILTAYGMLLDVCALLAPVIGSQSGRLGCVPQVRTIKNDSSRNESNKDMLKLKKQVEYWKEQAGLVSAEARTAADLIDIQDAKTTCSEDMPANP